MELRQIRSFLSIAETLHFGRTAELIHLSQPALSLQIRALEAEIGVRLLERNRRKTTLTAAGRAFRDAAIAGLSQLDRATRNARLPAVEMKPIRSSPSFPSAARRALRVARSNCESPAIAASRKARPAAVSVVLRRLRSSSRTPISASRARICRLRAG